MAFDGHPRGKESGARQFKPKTAALLLISMSEIHTMIEKDILGKQVRLKNRYLQGRARADHVLMV